MMYMPDCLLTLGIAFYDVQRDFGYTEQSARMQAELYMRRKDPDLTRMDAALGLADALARRATARLTAACVAIVEPPDAVLLVT